MFAFIFMFFDNSRRISFSKTVAHVKDLESPQGEHR